MMKRRISEAELLRHPMKKRNFFSTNLDSNIIKLTMIYSGVPKAGQILRSLFKISVVKCIPDVF